MLGGQLLKGRRSPSIVPLDPPEEPELVGVAAILPRRRPCAEASRGPRGPGRLQVIDGKKRFA